MAKVTELTAKLALDQAAAELSSQVHTGNGAVDALLGSKLSMAEQQRIDVRCELMIPDLSRIGDVDWCVLLSNALDNAAEACRKLEPDQRIISLKSKAQKGLFLSGGQKPRPV